MIASYTESDQWLGETVARIESNFKLLNTLLEDKPWVETFSQNATYLAWLNLEGLGIDNPASKILDKGRVSLVAGSDHSIDDKGYLRFARMNIGTYPEIIEQAIERINALAQTR